jgi:probable rRNA maturation factor
MQILLSNRQKKHRITTRQLKKAAAKILSDLGCPDGTELSVSIVGDRTIRRINRDYLAKDRPTNVISFSLREGEHGAVNSHALGDVIISADTAAREAADGGIETHERISFLLLHGILHLCGYDHERSGAAEAARMEAKEKELFRMIKKEGLLNLTGS